MAIRAVVNRVCRVFGAHFLAFGQPALSFLIALSLSAAAMYADNCHGVSILRYPTIRELSMKRQLHLPEE